MEMTELFWTFSLEEIKKGYAYIGEKGHSRCLICGEQFEDGEVFRLPGEDKWYDARKYAAYHVETAHGSMLGYLLGLDKKTNGLTDLQKDLIRDFAAGLSDAEIVKKAGSGSASTIRNHRFVLKEKARQAKLLLAVIELMEEGAPLETPKFVPVHRTATQVDERYAITEAEQQSVLKQYFPQGPDGPLTHIPRKEKKKISILRHIASYFEPGQRYTEKQVNEQLKKFWEDDYVTLRRYLIQYGFMDREENCSEYWLKV
ncbi:DUF2087 domain-containing protein [Paenibacillus radicis (ex Gao et al. 2016)]|uniref:Transcriptional regulator n=1 Tax=Paenibacillus radicis (ex Gao et al. 2016) TaxID=1737354 RepID=A0A917H0G2_9BACL|nr:DUF2087 domain-containing protein [Paenibacillus radicis (ex Gao et al. 2016)]GGG62861.1 transcriptional regulator [Paenibacillus radicis (ex Gao et al. 2016)]